MDFRENRKTAFEEIVKMKEKYVFAYAYSYLKNYDDALDVTQDVFIKLYKYLNRINAASFNAYLKKIMISCVMDAFRVRKKEHDLYKGLLSITASSNTDTYEDYDAARLLSPLSKKHQSVFLLRLEGNSISQIADILGIKEGTVLSRLFYARNKMAKILRRQKNA